MFSHQSNTTTRQQDKCWTCAFLWCLSHQGIIGMHRFNICLVVLSLSCRCLALVWKHHQIYQFTNFTKNRQISFRKTSLRDVTQTDSDEDVSNIDILVPARGLEISFGFSKTQPVLYEYGSKGIADSCTYIHVEGIWQHCDKANSGTPPGTNRRHQVYTFGFE